MDYLSIVVYIGAATDQSTSVMFAVRVLRIAQSLIPVQA